MVVWTHTPLAGGPSHKSLLSVCRVNWGHDKSENPNSDIVYLTTTAGNLKEMPKMMVWNRGKSFKISKFWVSVLNFRGLIQNCIPICGWMMFLSSLWPWDKNITCAPKKVLSPTQARHWLGEVSRDSVKPMGKLLDGIPRSRPLLLMVQKSCKYKYAKLYIC